MIPKTEQIKRSKSVAGRSHLDYNSGKSLVNSKYLELINFFEAEDRPKTEQIKVTKSHPGRSQLEYHSSNQ